MKPSKLMGVMSSGMVLCAKNPEAKAPSQATNNQIQ